MKWAGIIIGGISTLLVAALVVLMVYFGRPNAFQELERKSNPIGTIDAAVLWVGGGGAAGWSRQEIYLMPAGTSLDTLRFAAHLYLTRP